MLISAPSEIALYQEWKMTKKRNSIFFLMCTFKISGTHCICGGTPRTCSHVYFRTFEKVVKLLWDLLALSFLQWTVMSDA